MSLRTIALASTALVALAAIPAQAGQYMGKVNLGFGYAWEDPNYTNFPTVDYGALHGSGSVNVPYDDHVNVQFDLFGDASLDATNNPASYSGFGAGMHINYKDASMGALGVFATVGRAAEALTDDEHGVVFAAGLEGEYYCNAWTLSAQVGYLDTDGNAYGIVKNAGFAKVGAAYYASSKLKLAGSVGYLDGDTTTGANPSDVKEWNWAFSLEYMMGKSVPVSTYLEYVGQHSEAYSPNSTDINRNEVRAGVRFYFGGGDDLQKADREGAGFQSPDIVTWPRFDN